MNTLEYFCTRSIDDVLREGDVAVAKLTGIPMPHFKLIFIKGEPNVGKTTASRFLLELLLYKGAKVVSYSSNHHTETVFRGDFTAVVDYKGVTVAICSEGDSLAVVKKNVRAHIHCDVLVATSRNYPTFNKEFSRYNPIIHVKSGKSDYDELTKFVKKVLRNIP